MHLIIIIWGVTAENVAEKYKITRKEQDLFSLDSQQKQKKQLRKIDLKMN